MKTTLALLGAVLLGLAAPAFAQPPSGMHGMPMHESAQGTGVIRAIDPAKGTVTIQHQAIASIHWPAMTMTFTADPPSLLRSVKVGEKVNFILHPNGMHSTVTAIASAR